MHVSVSSVARRAPVGLFLVLLVVSSALFWWLSWRAASGAWPLQGPKVREWLVTGLMWCPGISALVACAITRSGWANLGMELPRARWLAFAFAYPLAYLVAAYLIVWLSGFGTHDPAMVAEEATKRYALPGHVSPMLVAFLVTATIGVLVEVGRSFGEELGWRGFLSPALSGRFGLEAGGLASGAIWGLWHFPLLIALGFGPLPAPYALTCFLLSTTSLGYVMAWTRAQSGSVWPAVIVHSVHNALLYPIFDMSTMPVGDRTAYATGETGFAIALVNIAGALVVWRSRRRAVNR